MPAPLFELNSGTKIPAVGLGMSHFAKGISSRAARYLFWIGTWQSKPNEVANAVAYALKEGGYRHIDCAWYLYSV